MAKNMFASLTTENMIAASGAEFIRIVISFLVNRWCVLGITCKKKRTVPSSIYFKKLAHWLQAECSHNAFAYVDHDNHDNAPFKKKKFKPGCCWSIAFCRLKTAVHPITTGKPVTVTKMYQEKSDELYYPPRNFHWSY